MVAHFEEGEVNSEVTRLEGFVPIRELPFGGSLFRTVVFNRSKGFTHAPRRSEGREMGTPISEVDGGSSQATLGGLDLNPGGARRGSGSAELRMTLSDLECRCNGYTVTESCHSRYTESNMYSSCTRVELRLFVHVSDVLYRLHVTSVTNTIYGIY